MSKSSRIRIRIFQRDGTCPTEDEPCIVRSGNVCFPRGKDVKVTVVNDDGTETALDNVKSVQLKSMGRQEPVVAVLELLGPVLDVVVPVNLDG